MSGSVKNRSEEIEFACSVKNMCYECSYIRSEIKVGLLRQSGSVKTVGFYIIPKTLFHVSRVGRCDREYLSQRSPHSLSLVLE